MTHLNPPGTIMAAPGHTGSQNSKRADWYHVSESNFPFRVFSLFAGRFLEKLRWPGTGVPLKIRTNLKPLPSRTWPVAARCSYLSLRARGSLH